MCCWIECLIQIFNFLLNFLSFQLNLILNERHSIRNLFNEINFHLLLVSGQKLVTVSDCMIRNLFHLIELFFCEHVQFFLWIHIINFYLFLFLLSVPVIIILVKDFLFYTFTSVKTFNSCLFPCFLSFNSSQFFPFLFENFINFIPILSWASHGSLLHCFVKLFIFSFIPVCFLSFIQKFINSFRFSFWFSFNIRYIRHLDSV